jgi:dihydroorotate dehydrogenase electron transfer subunit
MTEDGSFGTRGLIVEALRSELEKNGYDHIVTCGRELMMKKVLELADKYEIDCQLSLERYIKCGRGICGHCAINGYLVCKDGPVFSGDVVRGIRDFGKIQLDESGAPVELTF